MEDIKKILCNSAQSFTDAEKLQARTNIGAIGGVKVTTIAVVILYVAAFCRGKTTVSVFGRRLDEGQMRRAFCVLCFFVGDLSFLNIEL